MNQIDNPAERKPDHEPLESELLSSIIDTIDTLLIVLDSRGRIVRFNRACENLTGYRFEEVRGKVFWKFLLPEEEASIVSRFFENIDPTHFPKKRENYWLTKYGKQRLISWSNTTIKNSLNEVNYVVGTGVDVTEQRQAENSLRESYNLLRAVIEGTPDAIYVKDKAGRYQLINSAGAEVVGKSVEEIIGLDDTALFEEKTARRIIELDQQIIKSEGREIFENYGITRSGVQRAYLTIKGVYRDTENQVAGIIGISHDITKRKQTEETLRQSEERYRKLITAMSEGIIFQNEAGEIVACNDSAEKILGLTKDQIMGLTSVDKSWRTIHEDGSEFRGETHPAVITLQTAKPCKDVIMGVRRTDGSLVWISINSQPIFNPNREEPSGVVVSFTDITERKQAEERLKLLESAVQQSNDSIVVSTAGLDLPGPEIVFVNPAFTKMTGYKPEEIIGKTPRILQGEKTDRKVIDKLLQNLLSGKDFRGSTINYRKDGNEYYVEWSVAPIKDFNGKITHYIAVQEDITERKKAEERLLQINRAIEVTSDGIGMANARRESIYHNQAFINLLGYTPEQLNAIGGPAALYAVSEVGQEVYATLLKGKTWQGEVDLRCSSGEIVQVEMTADAVHDESGALIGLIAIYTDTRERKRIEQQIRQTHKMEAIGRLAGGVAHDFNNMLTAISGYSELTLRRLKADDPLRNNILEIKKAATHSANLTRQLLAFSRKQVQQLKILSVNAVIENLKMMLERLLGEDLEFVISLDPDLGQVKADPGQIEQILMNLVVNARDAMPDGGKIHVETKNVTLDREFVRLNPGSKAGSFVLLSVSDTGTGMDSETRARIFEPFFTTKESGKGTGLGLSTVYGIVKQSGGYITVQTEIGNGTVFKIYLPRYESSVKTENTVPRKSDLSAGGEETILLTEDEPQVRELTRKVLEDSGYNVLTAASPEEAIQISENFENTIHLLLTDVVMPVINGRKLAEILLTFRPEMRVLFISGYSGEGVLKLDSLKADAALLEKPFSPEDLVEKVREILDAA